MKTILTPSPGRPRTLFDFDYDNDPAVSLTRLLRPSLLRPIFNGVGLALILNFAFDRSRLTSVALLYNVDNVAWLGTLEQPYVATLSKRAHP